ncbi:glutamine amidotransferase-related protein [Photobacterium kasasachensis]|uniref:glutamine amidotransferase-related protein n=1 Tax=Photobacterium kasasachensis TaxID=2910240 RepID=UPI003D0FE1E2
MKIHFIVHEAFEGAGYFDHWVRERGYLASYSRVYLGEALPSSTAEFDCLIVLGGPQNPATSTAECAYFDSKGEQTLICSAINADKAVVGVCLGAQLIGESLGARYESSPEKEIGYFPIKLTEQGSNDIKLSAFESTELVGHWHNDMPGLTESAVVLASSSGCPRQIVRYADLVYGFQCHLEFVAAQLPALITHSQNDFSEREKHRYIQPESDILNAPTSRMNKILGDFLDRLVVAYCENKYRRMLV